MDEETLRQRIARMVAARERMNAGRDELNDLRREARAAGVNLQALNPLVDVLAEHRYDCGTRILNDLLAYAKVAGADLPLTGHGTNADATSHEAVSLRAAAVQEPETLTSQSERRRRLTRRYLALRLRLAVNSVLVGCLSAFLVWFLH